MATWCSVSLLPKTLNTVQSLGSPVAQATLVAKIYLELE